MPVKVVPFPDTLYVYVPVEFNLMVTRAAAANPFAASKPSPMRQVNFVETNLTNGTIDVRYDITPVTQYPRAVGYQSAYSDEAASLQSGLLQALTRAYGDLDDGEPAMDFVVLMIADIHNGLAIKNLFCFADLRKAMAQALPNDEYAKRYISDLIGDQDLIQNTDGHGLNFTVITWPEFMARQITYRINFKYTRSSFPPAQTDEQEILQIIRDTLSAYEFDGKDTIQEITLKNLAGDFTTIFTRKDLDAIPEPPEPRLFQINFDPAGRIKNIHENQ